jgi:hypothetical protein
MSLSSDTVEAYCIFRQPEAAFDLRPKKVSPDRPKREKTRDYLSPSFFNAWPAFHWGTCPGRSDAVHVKCSAGKTAYHRSIKVSEHCSGRSAWLRTTAKYSQAFFLADISDRKGGSPPIFPADLFAVYSVHTHSHDLSTSMTAWRRQSRPIAFPDHRISGRRQPRIHVASGSRCFCTRDHEQSKGTE